MSVKVTIKNNAPNANGVIENVELVLENEIDWDFSKWNPGLVKTSQNLREFDKWLTWIKNTFDLSVPFNYLEIGSYAGESLFYLSQIFPKGSQITLVDLGNNPKARDILVPLSKHLADTYGHNIALLSGYSNNPKILKNVMDFPKGQALYDMVFIDANHDYAWAYQDFVNYKDKANWVAFHDISDFNIVKSVAKYGRELANAAHIWKVLKLVTPQFSRNYPGNKEQNWFEFIDYDNDINMDKMDLKPRGIGVIKLC